MRIIDRIFDHFETGEFADPTKPLGAVVYALVFGALAWAIGRALRMGIQRILAYDRRAVVDRTTIKFLGQLAQTGVYLFAFISYAHMVPALAHVGTAWLASVSIISVVVGIAAQSTLGTLISGMSLLLYRPFNVGDRLQLNTPTGVDTAEVESLNLGYTILKTDDNRRIVVPNNVMASQTIINLTGEDPRLVVTIPFTVGLESDVEQVRAVLLGLAKAHPLAQQVLGCPVNQVGPAGLGLNLNVWVADPKSAGTLKADLLESGFKEFARRGIRLPSNGTAVTVQWPTASPPREAAAPGVPSAPS